VSQQIADVLSVKQLQLAAALSLACGFCHAGIGDAWVVTAVSMHQQVAPTRLDVGVLSVVSCWLDLARVFSDLPAWCMLKC
jgi:hypothetical protein